MNRANTAESKAASSPTSWYCLHPLTYSAQQASVSLTQSSAVASLDNRGLNYADGFFTTMAITDGEIRWAEYHWQRLASHAQALQLHIPKQPLFLSLISHAQRLQQGMMKVVVTRATQNVRGYGFSADAQGSACEVWLKLMPAAQQTTHEKTHENKAQQTAIPDSILPLADGRTITLQTPTTAICLTSQLSCLPPTLAGLKTLNRLDNVLASGELQGHKANAAKLLDDSAIIGEGLVRDMTGHWVEGTMSNVCYQLSLSATDSTPNLHNAKNTEVNYLTQGQWYTPPMTQSGVAGILRQVIIDSLATTENPIIIRPLTDEDLPKLSQLFFCNAVRGVMPMTALTLLSGEVVEFN